MGGRRTGAENQAVHARDAQLLAAALPPAEQEHLLRRTLSGLARCLGDRFVRIRRTALVNARAITALEPYGKGSYVVHLRGGTRLVSSRYAGRTLRVLIEG